MLPKGRKSKKVHQHQNKGASSQTSCIELVLFNSDSLFKIASYLTATDLLNLALTCKRFSVSESNKSLIEETARRIVQDIAIVTGEERLKFEATNTVKTRSQLKAEANRETWLASYHYLQSGVIFDQIHANFEYVEGNKSCIRRSSGNGWNTAFSNNIMKAGRHYVLFDASERAFLAGVMRPGILRSRTSDNNPIQRDFFNHQKYFQSKESLIYNTNNSIHSCMYYGSDGACYSCHWHKGNVDNSTRDITWRGSFIPIIGCKLGMLLDLDEGTLSVYKDGLSLGVMERGLVGHYCWVMSTLEGVGGTGAQVAIKRGTVPVEKE